MSKLSRCSLCNWKLHSKLTQGHRKIEGQRSNSFLQHLPEAMASWSTNVFSSLLSLLLEMKVCDQIHHILLAVLKKKDLFKNCKAT